MTEEVTQPEAQQPATGPELTVVDLQNIKAVLDVAARRGAFQAGELEAVGATYNKLAKFLEAVTPKQEDAPADTPAA